jgi:kynureninase
VLSLVAVEEGVRLVAEAGIDRIRAKGIALTSLAISLIDARLQGLDAGVGSPRDPAGAGLMSLCRILMLRHCARG